MTMHRRRSNRAHLALLLVLSFSVILGMVLYTHAAFSESQQPPTVRYALGASLGTVPVADGVQQLAVQGSEEIYFFIVETSDAVPLNTEVYAECSHGRFTALVTDASRMPVVRGDAVDLCPSPTV